MTTSVIDFGEFSAVRAGTVVRPATERARPDPATDIGRLTILPLRFELAAHRSLRLSDLSGAVSARGAFGYALRRLVCPETWMQRECRDCRLARDCAYSGFFEPTPPPEAGRLRANRDAPRPFVFKVAESDSFLDVTLIGGGAGAFPHFVVAVKEMGRRGIGPGRTSFKIRNVMTREERPRLLFTAERGVIQGARIEPVSVRSTPPGDADPPGRRTYRFVTPTVLKADGGIESVPSYGTLVRRARDRVNALATFFGDGPFEWDFREMGERADRVGISRADGGRVAHARYSRRRERRHDLSGFSGFVEYEGPKDVLSEFDPLLDLLDEIHVGKGSALGNGRVQKVRC